nr:immunoglobulin heavy chain junction region [Macaca mulatta]MOV88892.1 immunoglobulin heavy chain junction region [Macaca mulatta]MOV90704.1 immunoglobulin heavy chain junction region [Macaca mulatta]
CVKKEDSLDVW